MGNQQIPTQSTPTLNRLRGLAVILFCCTSPSHSYSLLPGCRSQYSCQRPSRLFSILDDNGKQDPSTGNFEKFNPLNYNAGSGKLPSSLSRISLRQTRMSELTSGLLDAVGDESTTQALLEEYREFLLEPLEDDDAVLEPGSIYTPGMTRSGRYQAYKASMEERIQACRNPPVRSVLESLRDFVLQFEDQQA